MFLIDIIFGKKKIYRLRKSYDRTREKADKIGGRDFRLPVLRMLDQAEPTLVLLEEHKISRFEKARMIKYVEAGIREAKKMMDEEKAIKKAK